MLITSFGCAIYYWRADRHQTVPLPLRPKDLLKVDKMHLDLNEKPE